MAHRHKAIHVRLPVDLVARITGHAARTHITRSSCIRDALLLAFPVGTDNATVNPDTYIPRRQREAAKFAPLKQAVRESNAKVKESLREVRRAGLARNSFDVESGLDKTSELTPGEQDYRNACRAFTLARVEQNRATAALQDSGYKGIIPGVPSPARVAAATAAHERRNKKIIEAKDFDAALAKHERRSR